MQSKAATVEEYLDSLPQDRRLVLEAVRAVIRKNLDSDFQEQMQYGMIGYCVPHSVFPAGYHCDPRQPLPYACLASQKNHMAVYLMSVYQGPGEVDWLRKSWAKTGKKLDMGKSCIRFKKLDDVALEVIGEAIRRWPAKKYIQQYQAILGGMSSAKASQSTAPSKKASTKKPLSKNAGTSQAAAPKKAAARTSTTRKSSNAPAKPHARPGKKASRAAK